jgi:glutamyl-Q tRNA(Asp) synthetase
LHFGSLIAAVGSYLDAHQHKGLWKIRIDDLDEPRNVPGATRDILSTLEQFGFEWDGMVMHQSHRLEIYHAGLEQLHNIAQTYDCGCSRKEIAEQSIEGPFGVIYPGTCRHGLPEGKSPRALRCIAPDEPVCLDDRLQGRYCQTLGSDVGDFVIRRADGIVAYQLATVIDDEEQGITDVVRGVDLLDSTPRQIHLQSLLGLETPRYLHLPIAVNQQHEKLSKQTHARALDPQHPVGQLVQTMQFLGQNPPQELTRSSIEEFWLWAKSHWSTNRVPAVKEILAAGHAI